MRNKLMLAVVVILMVLSACGADNTEVNLNDELPELKVEFEPSEVANVGDTVELKATVAYDDEPVEDADEVAFEYWENDDQDNSITIDSTNHKDGTYTADVTLENEAVYSIYAHTTARSAHTMPKRTITVGDPDIETADNDNSSNETSDGFSIHFMKPKDIQVTEETEFMVHLQIDDEMLGNADVHYEVWNEDMSEELGSIDAEESTPGEYISTYRFEEVGTYIIQIHVENDDDLHEAEEHEIEVK